MGLRHVLSDPVTLTDSDGALLGVTGGAIEVYETTPWYEGGTAAVPFYLSATAGTTCQGGATTVLPNKFQADRYQQWTPYIGIKSPADDVTVTFTYQASPDGSWAIAYPICDAAGTALTLTLTASATVDTWLYWRLPPMSGCDGEVQVSVTPSGAGAGAIPTILFCVIARP